MNDKLPIIQASLFQEGIHLATVCSSRWAIPLSDQGPNIEFMN